MDYIFYEGEYSIIVVTIIDYDKEKGPPPIVSSHKIYYYDKDEKLTYAHFGDPSHDEKFNELAEGLDIKHGIELPEQDASNPYIVPEVDPKVIPVESEAKYEFRQWYSKKIKFSKLLYHVVLPECFYCDIDSIRNRTGNDIIVVTRETRQTIDCQFNEGAELDQTITFKGPNEIKFNELKNKIPPKEYIQKNKDGIPE
jgi:hypothetical protein